MQFNLIHRCRNYSTRSILLFVVISFLGTPLSALGFDKSRYTTNPFPLPQALKGRVAFWERIFYTYPHSTMIIHEVDHPERIIDLLDFKLLARQKRLKRPPKRHIRNRIATNYLKRYELGLRRFKKHGKRALRFGAIEKRIYDIYSRSSTALGQLYRGKVKFRIQSGLSDEFRNAVVRSNRYLPTMERIFASYKLPRDLTRIAFVESMFNVKAKSRVGASGVWQFMPQTAKKFMYVNRFIDERNSPLKATKGAAQLLSYNYQEIKSWPLAITAYNHGLGGMLRAVKRLRTKDIGQIIRFYSSRTFGFASKNFYAEFLAARNVYPQVRKAIRQERSSLLSELRPITIDKKLSISQLLRHTPVDQHTLKSFNQCLLPKAFGSYKYRKLPPFFQIYLPKNIAKKVRAALRRINAPKYQART